MNIAGIQQSTMIDYPGKIACVVFLQGCNFRCHFCHNPECVLPEKIKLFKNDLIPEYAFFNFLKSRKNLLDGVSICGGEPTLDGGLGDFAKKIKDMGFSVKLDTNGRDYKIVEKMIKEGSVDYVAVDLKHSMSNYKLAVGVDLTNNFYYNYQNLLNLLLNSDIEYEYRTTVVKGLHVSLDIEEMAKYVSGIKNYYIQNYVDGNTLNPDFGGRPFDDEELLEFKNIASKYVVRCEIRN